MTTVRTSRSTTRTALSLAGAAVAFAVALGGCSSDPGPASSQTSVPPHPTSTSTAQQGQASGTASSSGTTSNSGSASGKGCAAIKPATLKALFTVPVGEPFDEGSGACGFGVGASATLTGSAVETTDGDNLLAQLIPGAGASWYDDYARKQPVTQLPGIGDKATFVTGNPLKVFALRGKDFCLIQIVVGDTSSVGLKPDPSGTIADQDAIALATKVGALCTDMFAGSSG